MKLLTEDAVLVCNHVTGTVHVSPTQRLVTIEGRRVLVEVNPEGRSITGCPLNPAAGMKPCTTTLPVQKGYSEWIRIDGKRVCLDTVTGLTDGTPPGTVHYRVLTPGQDLVTEAV